MNLQTYYQLDFPVFGFSHCKDVVVEVSKAGGFGVLGAVLYSPDELEDTLSWIDEKINGMPYGVDVIIPNSIASGTAALPHHEVMNRLPAEHHKFIHGLLRQYGIDPADLPDDLKTAGLFLNENGPRDNAHELLDVAFSHPISLIANALGTPPDFVIDAAKAAGVPVAALVGNEKHAIDQVQAGVDIIVAAGAEAGGHCGEISTMILTPQICSLLPNRVPILAAGGIMTGRQIAAAIAMGASGVWCGSVWLTTLEADTPIAVQQKLLEAKTGDTIRSRSRTGKMSRQLKSPWTTAWESPNAPASLPMPFQSALVEPYLHYIDKLAAGGHPGAVELSTWFVGEGVGLSNERMTVRQVISEMKRDYINAYDDMRKILMSP